MTTKDEALALALQALKPRPGMPNPEHQSLMECAIEAIEEVQSRPEQEPVACAKCERLKGAPPRQPLTDEQIENLWRELWNRAWSTIERRRRFARAIIAKVYPPEQEPVATIRTWHENGDRHAELCDWERGLYCLPDGEHNVYTSPPPRQPLTDELPALPEGKGVVRGPVAAFSQPECGTLVDFDCEGPLSHDPGDGEELFTADQMREYATAAIEAAHGIKGEA